MAAKIPGSTGVYFAKDDFEVGYYSIVLESLKMFQWKCFSVVVAGSRIREGKEIELFQKVFSRGKNLPKVMLLMVKIQQEMQDFENDIEVQNTRYKRATTATKIRSGCQEVISNLLSNNKKTVCRILIKLS